MAFTRAARPASLTLPAPEKRYDRENEAQTRRAIEDMFTRQPRPTPEVVTGSILFWPVATAPVGWLLCDGAAVSRTTYAALFSLIGEDFGAGNGTTTFNVPDLADYDTGVVAIIKT